MHESIRGASVRITSIKNIVGKLKLQYNTTKCNEIEAEVIAKTISTAIDEDNSTNKNLIIICGDFNGAKSNTLCRQLQIKQLNTIPTSKNKLLDPIFTNESNS
jgi:hypothetical protein